MNASAQDIAYLLNNQSSLALTLSDNLFWARIPESPQNCVSVLDRAGDPPIIAMSKAGSQYFYCGVVVYIRNIDYKQGYDQALAINQYLHGIAHTVIGDTYYSLVHAIGEPRLLHWDGNDRAMFVININIQRRYNN